MISNSWGVTNMSESFEVEVLHLSVMQSSFRFTNAESITIPATGFVRQSSIFVSGWNDLCKELRA